MMLGLALIASASIVVLLHFDGSFRGGRALDSHSGGGHVCHAAACAASLQLFSERGDLSSRSLAWLGGRRLDPESIESSGQAEYEGVLLGLEMLQHCVTEVFPQLGVDEDDWSDSRPWTVPFEVVVHGDCKTVIHQLQGRARARKLQAYDNRARKFLAALKYPASLGNEPYGSSSRSSLGDARPAVSFQHIPREQNALCDALADAVVAWEQQLDEQAAWKELDELTKRCTLRSSSACTSEEASGWVWEEAERRVLPHVQHSLDRRLALYSALAELSEQHRDFGSLRRLGQQLESDLRRRWRRTGRSAMSEVAVRWKGWQVASVTWQLQGLEGMGPRLRSAHNREVRNLEQVLRRLQSERSAPVSAVDDLQDVTPASSPLAASRLASSHPSGSEGPWVARGSDDPLPTVSPLHLEWIREWTAQAFGSSEWRSRGRYVLTL